MRPTGCAELDLDAGHVHGALERRDGGDHASRGCRLCGLPEPASAAAAARHPQRRRATAIQWLRMRMAALVLRAALHWAMSIAVDQMMPHDASTVLGDRCVRRVDGLGVHVVRPRREDAQRSQFAPVLVRDDVVRIIGPDSGIQEWTDRLPGHSLGRRGREAEQARRQQGAAD